MSLTRLWYTRVNVDDQSDHVLAASVASAWAWSLVANLMGYITGGTTADTDGGTGDPPAGSYWTLEGSSDGATAGFDATNRWLTTFSTAVLLHNTAGNAHSWIVLKSPAAMETGPWYLLIALDSATAQNVTIQFSKTAYSGGSATANATTASTVAGLVTIQMLESTTSAHKFHFSVDANGSFFYWASKNGSGIASSFLYLATMNNYATTGPYAEQCAAIMGADYLTTGRGAPRDSNLRYYNYWARPYNNSGASHNASGGSGIALMMHPNGSTPLNAFLTKNVFLDKWDLWPTFVINVTAAQMGFRGTIPDLYGCGAVPVGDVYPDTSTPQLVSGADFVWPCAGVPSM